MKLLKLALALGVVHLLALHAPTADAPAKRSAREALKPFNELVGSWRATGTPEGTRDEKQKGLWQESIHWGWRFKGNDAWLEVSFDKGKHFVEGTLHYLPDDDQFQLKIQANPLPGGAGKTRGETLVFTGPLKEHLLILQRIEPKTKETQRLVVSLLHDNRYLYHYEVKPEGKTSYSRRYLVGCTKEGVPFAGTALMGPFCVVSGGPPTSKVAYKGQTYYVCCGGCREAFNQEPEKYIKEYEELLAKLAKERAEKNKK